MRARLSVVGFAIVFSLCVWMIPTAAGAVGAAQTGSTHVPVSVGQCEHGGWQSLTNVQGQLFGNQGECISYFIHNPVSLTDLTGSFSGTTSYTSGTVVCSLIEQVFDATYLGSSAVGAVTLHLDGCVTLGVSFGRGTYNGTFTITTSVGTLNGNADGPITDVFGPPPTDFELTLTVVSGTGAFSGTTGTIHVSIQWPGGPSPSPVTGSVTIP